MKNSASLTLALGLLLVGVEASPAPQAAPGCSHNNCLRAVIAGSFPNRPTVADCSSYLRKTVTPAVYTETVWETITPVTETATSLTTTVETELTTVTVFETVDGPTNTVTVTVTPPPLMNKRDTVLDSNLPNDKRQVTVHPSAIPTYATACKSAAAYSSACSCIGVEPTTITVATPTSTVTSTSTVTAKTTLELTETLTTTVPVTETETETLTATTMSTVTLLAVPRRFHLRVSAPGQPSHGKLISNPKVNSWPDIEYLAATSSNPTTFTIDFATGAISSAAGYELVDYENPNIAQHNLMSKAQQLAWASTYKKSSCSISPVDLKFSCKERISPKPWKICSITNLNPGATTTIDALLKENYPTCYVVDVYVEAV